MASAKKIGSVLALALLALSSVAQADEHTEAWTGIDFSPRSVYGYVGAFTTLQGQTIHQEGWLLRGSAGYGRFRYNTTAVLSGHVTGHVTDGDLMAGYQSVSGPATAKFFIGPDVENLRDSPTDPNSHHGTRAGAKALAEIETKWDDSFRMGAMGDYSTAFQTYWSRIDGGFNFWHLSVGPEVQFLGNDDFNQFRFGGAISGINLGPVSFRGDAGKAWTRGNGKDGAYGGVSVSVGF